MAVAVGTVESAERDALSRTGKRGRLKVASHWAHPTVGFLCWPLVKLGDKH